MSNVTTHSRFGANIEQLRAAGVEINIHQSDEDLADIKLDEPRYGEALLGDLTADEKALFVELFRATTEFERLTRDYMGSAITRVGERIRQSDAHKPLHEAFTEEEKQLDFGTPKTSLPSSVSSARSRF